MQIQESLFADPVLQLLDDAEGGMTYYPDCVPPRQAHAWFVALRQQVRWRHLRRPMYERVVDVPRLVANLPLDAAGLPPCLHAARAAVARLAPAPYTHVGLNLYRDQQDSVAPHGDREGSLVPGQPIAILSLGVARDMLIRPRGGGAASQRIGLQPGSLLVMSHASQSTHEHGIPKARTPLGPRISLAFRVRRTP